MKNKKFFFYAALLPLLIVSVVKPRPTLKTSSLATMTINIDAYTDSEINNYYAPVAGLKGDALQAALHELIDDHQSFTYSETVDIMKITDRNWTLSPMTTAELTNWVPTKDTGNAGDPYLYLMYGGLYNNDVATAYKWSADHSQIWNKEHIWAKSHGGFGEEQPAGTDLHHLRAADQYHNSTMHSNYDYDNVTSNITYGKDERGNTTTAKRGYSTNSPSQFVFEPADEDKGDIARSLLYMPTRYYQFINVNDPKLVLKDVQTFTNVTKTGTASDPGAMAYLQTLLAWNKLDPVDQFEINRNNLIHLNFQKNRNPFIDHPEWADIIYDPAYAGAGASVAPNSSTSGSSIYVSPLKAITLTSTGPYTVYQNATFNPNQLVVEAEYEDGYKQIVTTFTLSTIDTTTVGDQTIILTYQEGTVTKSLTFTLSVLGDNRTLSHLVLDTSKVNKTFKVKDVFNVNDLVVTAHYTNGSTEVVTNYEYALQGGKYTTMFEKAGSYDVIIKLTHAGVNKEASYQITVTGDSLVLFGLTLPQLLQIAGAVIVVLIALVIYFTSTKKKQKKMRKSVVKSVSKAAKKKR